MPYLQFDLPAQYPVQTKQRLAERVGRLYAEIMLTTPRLVKVAFRELGPGNLVRCTDSAPEPVAVIMCDIRHGRPAEQRARFAAALVAAAAEDLQLSADQIEIEFSQHSGDEMYRRGAFAAEWSHAEATPG